MPALNHRWALAALCALLGGCGAPGDEAAAGSPDAARAELGLMTSLPLYWPLGAELSEIVAGSAPAPWQRAVLEQSHALVLLDTLSPIEGLGEGANETDPLEGLGRLAVIQPRGLAPADNVALDDWVRAGGRLLIVLDPQLSGDYDLPLGDPRRPADGAVIPPVVARWGLAISFDEDQGDSLRYARIGGATIPLRWAGTIALRDGTAGQCTVLADGAAARCRIGEGQVTLLADATMFEDEEPSAEARAGIAALLRFAFE